MNHSESKLDSTLERRTSILDRLELHSRVGVPELSSEFGVSQVTIRNDFAQLEAKGLLIRTRGGAMMSNRVSIDLQLSDKSKIHAAGKWKIGRKAASLIENEVLGNRFFALPLGGPNQASSAWGERG